MFTGWVKYIIFVVLFASFLEILLPSSSMQRFVRVIMGLFIMLAILNPVIAMVQNRLALANQLPVLSNNSANSTTMMNEVNHITMEREKLSLELYKKELAQQIKILIMTIDGVADVNVVIDINATDGHNPTNMIKNVLLYVKPGISSSNSGVIGNVSKISIGEQNAKTEELQIEFKKKIIQIITELYHIPKERIEIKILHS